MPFGTTSMTRLSGVLPETLAAAVELERRFNAAGGDLTIPEYGGFRGNGIQAQLYQWMLDSIAKGTGAYAVAPPGDSKHERGEAFDARVIRNPSGWSEGQSYKWLADQAPSIGLRAGYYFGGGPPSKKADIFHFELSSRPPAVPDYSSDVPTADAPPWSTAVDGPPPVDGLPDDTGGTGPSGFASGTAVIAIAVLGLVGLLAWRRFRG